MRFLTLFVMLVAATAMADVDESRTAIDFIGGVHVLANRGDDSGVHLGGGAGLRVHDLLPTHRLDIELGWERTRMHGELDFDRFDRFWFLVGTGFDIGGGLDLCVGGGIEALDAEFGDTSLRLYAPVASGSVSRFINLGIASLGAELVMRLSGHKQTSFCSECSPFDYVGADVELRVVLRL